MKKHDLANTLDFHGYSLAKLARELGVNRSTVSRWAQRRVPAERVAEIHEMTGAPKHQLRPDLYGESE